MTLRDLFAKSLSATITCAATGNVVRHLTLAGRHVDLRAADGSRALIDADETLVYEPWFMDRGSVLVKSCSHGEIKFCTEFDLIALDDGTVWTLESVDGRLLRSRSLKQAPSDDQGAEAHS